MSTGCMRARGTMHVQDKASPHVCTSPHGVCECLCTHPRLIAANASQPDTAHVTFWFLPGPRSWVLISESGVESNGETEPTS